MKTAWIFLLLFPQLILGVVFIQSGLDKILDWRGNLSWIQGHFSKSPLRRITRLLLLILTGLETIGGLLSLVGSALVLIVGLDSLNSALLEVGLLGIGLALIGLMLGQRLAKDYAGAASLVNYSILLAISFFCFTIMVGDGISNLLN
jgi:hypothetical protein